MKKRTSVYCILIAFLFGLSFECLGVITTLNKNDPLPLFSTQYPYSFLGMNSRAFAKDCHSNQCSKNISLAVTPFFQWASCGKDYMGNKAELGDLGGKWNMIALTGTPRPCTNCTLDKITSNLLDAIERDVFDDNELPPVQMRSIDGLLCIQQSNTTTKNSLGFFSVSERYRKRGVRFQLDLAICGGLGISLKTGIADIGVTPTAFTDLTVRASTANPFDSFSHDEDDDKEVTTSNWNAFLAVISMELMAKLDKIADSIGLDLCPYRKTDIEDFYGEIFWRYPFPVNRHDTKGEWPKFLFIPFFSVGGSLNAAQELDTTKAFALTAGNNKHQSWFVQGGFTFDFYDTLEIGTSAGYTHWNSRVHQNVFVPSHELQAGIFPCKTTVCVDPGDNFYLAGALNAYRFTDHLSFYLQYVYMSHHRDSITVSDACGQSFDTQTVTDDCGVTSTVSNKDLFMPELLECVSPFSAQVLNFGFNYELSPNFLIGTAVQYPINRKNAFRATTWLFSAEFSW